MRTCVLVLLLGAYLVDILCLSHVHGGLNSHAVRRWYHKELGDKSPIAGKTKPTDRILHQDEDGVTTESNAGPEVEYDGTICSIAKKAVEVRASTRYSARKKGSMAMRSLLYIRDFIKYKGQVDFTFEDLKQREKDRAEPKDARGQVPMSEQELCIKVYESSKRTNEWIDARTITKRVEDDDVAFTKEDIFGTFTGYSSFVIETTILYLTIALSFLILFVIVGKCGSSASARGARGGESRYDSTARLGRSRKID